MCAEGVGEHTGWKKKKWCRETISPTLEDFWPQALGFQSLVSQDGDANAGLQRNWAALRREGASILGRGSEFWGMLSWGRMARQPGELAAWGICSLRLWSQAQRAAGGLRTPDPSPGCLLQHPALGRVQAGTCPRSLACPGLLPSSAIICFL